MTKPRSTSRFSLRKVSIPLLDINMFADISQLFGRSKSVSPDPNEGLKLLTSSAETSDNGSEYYGLDIIAIHGLNGHPRNTWTSQSPGGETFWLQDLLPASLPGARVFTFGYDSRTFFSESTSTMNAFARNLLDHLEFKRKSEAVWMVSSIPGNVGWY